MLEAQAQVNTISYYIESADILVMLGSGGGGIRGKSRPSYKMLNIEPDLQVTESDTFTEIAEKSTFTLVQCIKERSWYLGLT